MSLIDAADRLADLDERLLAAGLRLPRRDRIRQARRQAIWARQWLKLARIDGANDDALLIEANFHIRRALAALDREATT